MADDEIGTMILSSDNLNSSLIMPEIPIRPNSTIPKTIGILLLLGGLMISLFGLTALSAHYLEMNYEEQTKAYQLIGVDINAEELEKLDLKYKETNYYLITGLSQIFPGLLLILGGIQLFICKKTGVYTSITGGLMWFILNLFSSYWGSSIDSDLGISLETQWDIIEATMCYICNIFCILLPLIPMFAPAGRAALSPQTSVTKSSFKFEEE
ncbi:MAG: hypothetical protein CMB64_06470 [Euryarchaeota archaeon]|nr:hypothetical protein [Euryarchaeota archaeon]